MRDVVVVGAGPAGLAATQVCLHWGLDTLLISEYLGGRTNFHLKLPFLESDDFIRGSKLAMLLRDQIKLLDWPHLAGRVDRVIASDTSLRFEGMGFLPVEAKLGIVATGARPERLNVPGEREFIMRGVAYSTGWYAPLFAGRTVAIVGTGLRAIQGVHHLSAFARKIYLIVPSTQGPVWNQAQTALQSPQVTLLAGWRVAAIEGGKYAERVLVQRQDVEQRLDVDGIFVCAGIVPNSACVAHLVDLDPTGSIMVDAAQRTSDRRLLAAGDVTDALTEQVLVALGAGAQAGTTAWETRLSDGANPAFRGRHRELRGPTRPKGHAQNGH